MKPRNALVLATIIILGLAVRLFLASITPGNYDMESYQIVIDILRNGGNIFAETSRYNYSPVWSYILLGIDALAGFTHLPFPFAERAFISFVDLADAFVIGLIASKMNKRGFLLAFAVYFLNPISILLSGVHGQFENLAALPLLIAVYLYNRAPSHRNLYIWLLGTISLTVKQITLPGVWMIFSFMTNPLQAFIGLLLSVVVLAASFIVYLPAGADGILNNVLLYTSSHWQYGLSTVMPRIVVMLIFMVVSVILPYIARHKLKLSLETSMTFAFVSFLAFAPGIAVQYFLLPVLFGSIQISVPFFGYCLLTTYFLLGNPDNLALPIPFNWNIAWIGCAAWFIHNFIKSGSFMKTNPSPGSIDTREGHG